MLYRFAPPPLVATFVRRANRFTAEVWLENRPELAHLPNSGRLTAVLAPGRTCWLRPQPGAGRKTKYDLLAVETERGAVLVDAHLPNRLVSAAWRQGLLPGFCRYEAVQAEYRFGHSRLDLAFFHHAQPSCLVEIKSAADFHDNTARFPDAPSLRAAKHLRELSEASRQGYVSVAIFLAQMHFAEAVALNAQIDPEFVAEAVRAKEAGVQLLAYNLIPQLPLGIAWGQAIPLLLP